MLSKTYRELLKQNKVHARTVVVMLYEQYKNYMRVARALKMDRHTVKKLVMRYKENQLDGLEDLSRRPKHSPNRIGKEIEEKVIGLRKMTNYGATRLAMILRREGVKISSTTIKKILKRHGLSKPYKIRTVRGYRRVPYFWDEFSDVFLSLLISGWFTSNNPNN